MFKGRALYSLYTLLRVVISDSMLVPWGRVTPPPSSPLSSPRHYLVTRELELQRRTGYEFSLNRNQVHPFCLVLCYYYLMNQYHSLLVHSVRPRRAELQSILLNSYCAEMFHRLSVNFELLVALADSLSDVQPM